MSKECSKYFCRNKVSSGFKQCGSCREWARLNEQQKRAFRRANGICSACGKYPSSPNSYCKVCQEYHRKYKRKVRADVAVPV